MGRLVVCAMAAVLLWTLGGEGYGMEKVVKTDEEWRAILTPDQYHVTRQKGTEMAFTGASCANHVKVRYVCVC